MPYDEHLFLQFYFDIARDDVTIFVYIRHFHKTLCDGFDSIRDYVKLA